MKNLLILAVTLSFLFIGCEAPEGPQGDTGPQGPQGEQGPPGSANVSSFIGIWNESDVSCGDENCTIAFVNFDASQITADNVDNIIVQAFYNSSFGGSGWVALPLTSSDVQFTYAYDVGIVQLMFISTDGSTLTTDVVPEGRAKFTFVPPSSSAKIKPLKEGAPQKPGLLFLDNQYEFPLK